MFSSIIRSSGVTLTSVPLIAEHMLCFLISANLTLITDFTIFAILISPINVYLTDSLKNLNRIRNGCSHVLEYKVSESDIDKIGRPFTNEYIKLKSECFNNIETLLNYMIGLLVARLDGCVEKIANSK